jgi:hypothetical protein
MEIRSVYRVRAPGFLRREEGTYSDPTYLEIKGKFEDAVEWLTENARR